MNREFEFRGKLSHSGEWVYGSLLKIDSKYHIVTESDMYEDGHHICQESDTPTWVDPDTVGEFTGIMDKHGKKIFEGDILLWTRKSVHIEGSPIQDFSDKCIIYYDNDKCGFKFRCKLDCGSCVGSLDFSDERAKESYIEVIGNIYDNPELLNKK